MLQSERLEKIEELVIVQIGVGVEKFVQIGRVGIIRRNESVRSN